MLRPETSAALDAYSASKAEPLTRPQAIRSILVDWLAANGFMKQAANHHPQPLGPAIDAVEATRQDHTKSEGDGDGTPKRGKRQAAVKEIGEAAYKEPDV